jgi:hypothetical protein
VPVTSLLTLHTDLGYDYNFDVAELRRFVWNVGVSLPFSGATTDFGVGGSEYNKAVRWTPTVVREGLLVGTALESNQLGDSFVDFLGGIKWRPTKNSVLSGAISVPLNNEGFRPVVLGTVAAELYF